MRKLGSKQIALFVFALCALGAAGYMAFRPDPSQPQIPADLDFVCVQSGERFTFPREASIIPMKHPTTGERTLVPCTKNEAGKLVVFSRYREAVTNLAEKNKYVDLVTLEVREAP